MFVETPKKESAKKRKIENHIKVAETEMYEVTSKSTIKVLNTTSHTRFKLKRKNKTC